MNSDIILNDENVEIVGEKTEINSRNHKIMIDSSKIELDSYEVSIPKQAIEMRVGHLRIGDRHAKTNKHSISVSSEAGRSSMSPRYIRTGKVYANEMNTKDLMIGLSPDDNPKPGNIKILNKQGEAAITIDGDKEDITLKAIGSLTDKIKELENEISDLKKLHRKFIRLNQR